MMKRTAVACAVALVCTGALSTGFVGMAYADETAGVATAGEASSTAQALRQIRINDNVELSIAEPVRLSQLLEYVIANGQHALAGENSSAEAHEVYWPQARLILLDRQPEVEAARSAVLADLNGLANYWRGKGGADNAAKAAKADAMAAQVRQWQLGFQPYGGIDIADARQHIADNPLLPPGQYQLWLPPRPDHVWLLGFLSGAVVDSGAGADSGTAVDSGAAAASAHVPRQTVRGYVIGSGATSRVASAGGVINQNTVWHVGSGSSSGSGSGSGSSAEADHIKELPWGMHNAEAHELLPGDALFLGFEKWRLPRAYRHLHDSLPALLEHFVSGGDEVVAVERNAPTAERNITRSSSEPKAANHWTRLSRPATPGGATSGNYGGAGLVQMPNARFGEEGELRISYTDMNEYKRYAVSLQVLDWVEATGFYVRVPSRLYSNSPGFSGNNIYTDKGFDLKMRLWQETAYFPQVALGIKDIGGTGLFAAEYLVASKQYGPFDFSLGAGFGRMGTRDHFDSPFCSLVDNMCERPEGFSGSGGKFEYDSWFRGPMALFAGVEYQTPWAPLRVKVEYDSNNYTTEYASTDMTPRTPINVGLNYRVNHFFDLYAGYERGDTFTFGFSLRTNLNTLSQPKIMNAPVQPQPDAERTYEYVDAVNWRSVNRSLQRQYAYSGGRYLVHGDEDEQVVTMYAHPRRLRDGQDMIDRASRVFAAELPDSVKTYEFVEQSTFMPMVKTTVDAEAFKAAVDNRDPDVSPRDTSSLFVRSEAADMSAVDDSLWVYNPEYSFSNSYGMKPHVVQSFGAPETFHFYQVGVKAFARRWLSPNVELFGEVGVNLFNNFDKFNFTVDAFDHLPVPRVRTYVREYMLNDIWLDTLQATYYDRLSDNVYAMAYGGMLERMYGGVGGELLYRPLDRNWAVGVDVNQVWQRDFNGAFGFRNYNEVTGFVSLYYQVPWLHDSLVTLRAGQFLAGDKGVNVTFRRRFDSGVTVGAWASFTDVSSTDYGEGSFSKGFFLTIPFDIMSVFPSREHIGFSWIPLNRDGGQMLHRRSTLHSVTEPRAPYYNR